ncbi:MAG: energy-coupling factor transporter transmembrane protein EcfT [Clostridia bacterium]|nr:energy-coupling factor transporter transmembrane protein EcfT [Clostridia bacterium]MBR3868912.1 energy-coupling factor transporter transmembrane protein EcfT [Clostridia bacterium]
MRDSFSEYHPFINLIYFAFTISFSLVLTHPLAQGISLICAVIYAISINGKKSVKFLLKYCLPMVLLTAFINPAFNHEGATTLLYFPNGNPLTLESILYGFSAGVMIITTLMWFSSFNRVMTTDKFIYLFGKVIPALSLVLSMSLRFVPKFKSQMQTVTEAQRSIGRDVSNGSLLQRTKTAIHIFSIMITWSLENAIETADSMKSRGYGLKGRTAFSIYRFEERDKYALIWLSFCGLFIIAGTLLNAFGFRYFPDIRYAAFDMTTIPFYCVYSALCITPVILNFKEEKKWKISVSEM